MKYFLFVFICCVSGYNGWSQSEQSDKEAVKEVVLKLFDGMRAGDSAMVHSVFYGGSDMHTVFTDDKGNNQIRKGSLEKFLSAVGSPHDVIWDEPVWDMKIDIDGALASVWTKYAFYAGKQFSHCGVDAFQLFKSEGSRKIIQITDTRQKEGCIIPDEIQESHK